MDINTGTAFAAKIGVSKVTVRTITWNTDFVAIEVRKKEKYRRGRPTENVRRMRPERPRGLIAGRKEETMGVKR